MAPVPDVLVVYIVTPVVLNPDQFIDHCALFIVANAAVGTTEFGVLLKVILYTPVAPVATLTLAALLLLYATLAEPL